MDFAFTYSPLYLLLIVPIAGALTYWMYLGTRELLSRGQQILLNVFRFGVLTLLGLLLLEPLITSLSKLSFPPIIAVLQDNSESLIIQKDSTFVRESYPQKLKSALVDFDEGEYQVDLYRFASEVSGDANPDSLSFDQTGTNLSAALDHVENLYQNQNLGAVVLISDGIPTAGVNPLYTIEGIRQPVFSVLLGDTTAQRDIRIQEVLFNEIAYLNTELPVRVKVRNLGFDQANLKVTLRDRNRTIGTKSLTLNRGNNEGTVDFSFQPEEVGLQQYTVVVTRLDGEITYRNNVRSLFINVLETQVKIALFAGGPHPDLGALDKALAREESYELTEFVVRRPGVFYNDPGAYNLEDFDLFILHNFPQGRSDEAQISRLVDQIKNTKKPVLYFVGIGADLNAMQPLFDYMALIPRGISNKSEEVLADFQPPYRDHSTYTFTDNWIQWVNNAPPLYRNQSDWDSKATAEVYATAKIKNVALPYPVFALQNQLGRKNAVLLGENFWRWRAHSYLESNDFELFDAWLFNLIKWLRVTDDKRKFIVEPSQQVFTGSDAVIFKGQVYDDSYNPVSGVEINLRITGPDGKEEEYYLNETGDAQYFLELYNLGEGAYSYTAEGRKNERKVGSDRGQFSIGRSNVEHFQLQADQDLMQQIALRTGGDYLLAQNLDQLPDQLKALPGLKPVIDYKRNRRSIQDYWWIMVLLLALLSAEWVVRKVNSLL